jgi:hypothetical protein
MQQSERRKFCSRTPIDVRQMFFLDEAESMPWTAAEVLLEALRTTAVLGACSSHMGVRISQAAPITPHGNICSNSRE